jgi:DNA polymerase-1
MAFGSGHHLHLIDGSAFIFRAFHALPPLTRKSDGLPVGAVAGFCNMLLRYIETNSGPDAATHVAVIFDFSSKSFRNDMYDQYKAHRPKPPEDLVPQFPLTRDATRAFGIACHEIEGFEADDIIATLTCRAREVGGRVTIVSSDKDMMQLVGGGVEMLDPIKNKRIDRDGVFEKFGVFPDRVVDVQALMGDSVDNVPGAPGIGPKTAAQLIQEYGDLETLLERAGEIKQDKRRAALIDHADQIRLSKRLVTLHCDMPLDFDLDSLEVREPDPATILEFLGRMEFRSLSKKVAQRLGVEPPAIAEDSGQMRPETPRPRDAGAATHRPGRLRNGDDPAALNAWVARIRERGLVAVDTETTSLDEMRAELAGISLATEPNVACYIPVGHRASASADLFGSDDLAPGSAAGGGAGGAAARAGSRRHPQDRPEHQVRLEGAGAPRDRGRPLRRHHADELRAACGPAQPRHGRALRALPRATPHPDQGVIGVGKSQVTFDRVPIERAPPTRPRTRTSRCACG